MLSVFFGVCVYLFLPTQSMDSASRYLLYENFTKRSFNEFFYGYLIYRTDYLFYILIYLFSSLGIKFQYLLFLVTCFNVGTPLFIYSQVINKSKLNKKEYLFTTFLIILSISFTFLFSGIRQLIAFNFIFLSFYFFFFKINKKLSFLFIVFGVLTHFSVVIYLPILFIVSRFDVRFLGILIFLIFIIGLILPDDFVKTTFLEVDIDSQVYNNKIEAYSSTTIGNNKTTRGTLIAKYLNIFWFYLSLFYLFLNKRKHTIFYKMFLLILFPVSLFITFPGISGRYIDFLKMFLALLLIDDFINSKSKWIWIFLFLFSIEPLYDVFRLMTDSFMYGIASFENFTLYQILIKTYTYKDLLPI